MSHEGLQYPSQYRIHTALLTQICIFTPMFAHIVFIYIIHNNRFLTFHERNSWLFFRFKPLPNCQLKLIWVVDCDKEAIQRSATEKKQLKKELIFSVGNCGSNRQPSAVSTSAVMAGWRLGNILSVTTSSSGDISNLRDCVHDNYHLMN